MPIVIGAKGATLAGINYAPYQYVDWLTADQEAVLIQGGGAVSVPARLLSAAEVVTVRSLVSGAGVPGVYARPWRIATWGQERAYSETTAPEILTAARFNNTRSAWWACAYRGDSLIVADYGIGDGGTGIRALDWNSKTRSQGRTYDSLAAKAAAGQLDAVLMSYGGTDIVLGNGTTPTAATVAGYLQANLMALLRLGVGVIVEAIYPYMAVAVYRGVTSGWTAQGSGTAAQKQAIADQVNSLMRDFCAQFPKQVIWVDCATPLKDATGFASKTYMVDGIELNRAGAQVVGKLVADASKSLLAQRQAHYLDYERATTPNLVNLVPGFSNYTGGSTTQGTVSWGSAAFGVDQTYGPYIDISATCTAITGNTPLSITAVSWAAGRLSFTVASHKLMPTQRFITSGLSSANAVDLTGPWDVDSNDSETIFSALLPTDPGAITIAGSPPSASSQITVLECTSLLSIFTEIIRSSGSPTTGITLLAGDMLQSAAWVSVDDGAGGTPPLNSIALRQRLYYTAGTPTTLIGDGGIVVPTSGNPAMREAIPLGSPVRMVTIPMISSNTVGGGTANISAATQPTLQVGLTFGRTGTARMRIYSPSMRVIRPGPLPITTPASGTAYVNKDVRPMRVVMAPNGATVATAVVSRNDANATYSLGASFLTGGDVWLDPWDALTLTYSAATPTLTGLVSV